MERKSAGEARASFEGSLPGVSVVIPTRDRLQLLERAIAGVLGQDYAGTIECVVVFDQSEPKLPAVPIVDRRSVRAIPNTRTPGLAGARNSGILSATGDVVAFCDDDDEWVSSKLTRQVDALARHPDASLISSGIDVVYGDRVNRRLPPAEIVRFADLLRSRITEIHPSTYLAYREAVTERIGLVDENIPGSYSEDYEWLLRAAKAGPIVCVPDALTLVHWHRSSFFTGRWEMIVSALQYLLDRYPEFDQSPQGLARICGQVAFAYAAAGKRRQSYAWIRRTLKNNWRERRAYVALGVTLRLFKAETVMRTANALGRGI